MDNLYKLLVGLVDKPLVPRYYRELRNYYIHINKSNEAAAFDHLIERKFNKKDEIIDNSSNDPKQRRDNSSNTGVDSTPTN